MMQDKSDQRPLFTEQQKRDIEESKARHQQKLETDPEYRAKWEKTVEHFRRTALIGDSEMD